MILLSQICSDRCPFKISSVWWCFISSFRANLFTPFPSQTPLSTPGKFFRPRGIASVECPGASHLDRKLLSSTFSHYTWCPRKSEFVKCKQIQSKVNFLGRLFSTCTLLTIAIDLAVESRERSQQLKYRCQVVFQTKLLTLLTILTLLTLLHF